jgi:uncharacterized Zn finger protein (UPF0148 family)
MQCPQCGARTEVVETRGPFRDRRCKKAECRLEFTTREQIMKPLKHIAKPGEHGRLCARTRVGLIQPPAPPVSGVAPKPVPSRGAAVASCPSQPATSCQQAEAAA